MNLLLLGQEDCLVDGRAHVDIARYPPRAGIWPPPTGRVLRIGLRNGCIGEAAVTAVGDGRVELRLAKINQPPPAPLPLTLLLALPRPKMLRRALRSATELGIKRVVLLNAARVDKSYWQSPLLSSAAVGSFLREGLEQCIDTVMPEVLVRQRFRPFVEDELPAVVAGTTGLVAHPAASAGPPQPIVAPVTLAIGPEGGFTAFEIGLLQAAGLAPFNIGPRVLRVETALPALVSTLLPCSIG